MEEKLIKYLKDNKLYSKFMKNMKRDAEYETLKEIIDYCEATNIKYGIGATPITTAFIWDKTPEGYAFWSNVNAAFCKL